MVELNIVNAVTIGLIAIMAIVAVRWALQAAGKESWV